MTTRPGRTLAALAASRPRPPSESARSSGQVAAVVTATGIAVLGVVLLANLRPARNDRAVVTGGRDQPPSAGVSVAVSPACRGADLRLAGVEIDGAGGHLGRFVNVTNVGRRECTLSGTPELSGLDDTGARVRIPVEAGTFFDWPEAARQPATIHPMERGAITIETSTTCGAGAATEPAVYRRVEIRLRDGATFAVAAQLRSRCPVRMGTWYRAAPAE